MEKKYSLSEFGYEAIVGKFAKQSDSSVWFQQGGTVILATVVTAPSEEFPGFFPLMIDYREQFAAAGRIPGGYLKREGRPSDQEVLTGRLIDRAIRPLFPENYFDKVQINITVYSLDQEHSTQTIALIGASLALHLSKAPFMGPVGICEVGRINGTWIYNPTIEQAANSDVKLLVAGTAEGVNMVEGVADEISEEEFVDVMFQAHDRVKKQVAWQKQVAEDREQEKVAHVDSFNWSDWEQKAQSVITEEKVSNVFVADKEVQRSNKSLLKDEFLQKYDQEIKELGISETFLSYVFDKVLKEAMNEMIFKRGKRIDDRDFETVRSISTEVGLLPFCHGSALFTRGRTQALVNTTLGGGQDQMRVDMLRGEVKKTFMLHYNFPAFSVGEVRPNRGVGRREVGHGYLALSAIEPVLPSQEKFPYTIRVVSDILESDGSSSMATVCGTTMSLMSAGVPLRKMVSGVAMGLLMSKAGDYQVITDIAGIEDAFGFMDFKVAGTEDGITAIQMDIKYKGGLARDIFEKALAQAKRGRLHIMNEMKKVMTKPAALSKLVPQVVSFKISKDKIGAVIGSGGKVIKEIIERTDTSVDIEDDGVVKILGHPGPLLDKAVAWAKILGGQIEVGVRYPGVVKRTVEFGMFVEVAPGQDGLVHVSTVPRNEQDAFFKKFKEGDNVTVEVLDYDKSSGRIRLKVVE